MVEVLVKRAHGGNGHWVPTLKALVVTHALLRDGHEVRPACLLPPRAPLALQSRSGVAVLPQRISQALVTRSTYFELSEFLDAKSPGGELHGPRLTGNLHLAHCWLC
jgi:hypothetical protein